MEARIRGIIPSQQTSWKLIILTDSDIKHSKAHAPNASALQKVNILGLSLSCCKSLQLLCPCSSPCSLSSTITKQTEEVSWQTQTEWILIWYFRRIWWIWGVWEQWRWAGKNYPAVPYPFFPEVVANQSSLLSKSWTKSSRCPKKGIGTTFPVPQQNLPQDRANVARQDFSSRGEVYCSWKKRKTQTSLMDCQARYWLIHIHTPNLTSLYAIWWRTLRGLCQIVIERLLWSIILNFRLQQHNSMSILFDSSVVTFFSSKPVDTQRSGILDLVRIRIKVPIWSGKSPDFGLQDPEKENFNLFRLLFSYFEG